MEASLKKNNFDITDFCRARYDALLSVLTKTFCDAMLCRLVTLRTCRTQTMKAFTSPKGFNPKNKFDIQRTMNRDILIIKVNKMHGFSCLVL